MYCDLLNDGKRFTITIKVLDAEICFNKDGNICKFYLS